jgi:hypothetical protein
MSRERRVDDMNRYALVFGIMIGLAEPLAAALPSYADQQRFNQEACRGSRLGEAECIRRLNVYCSKPNKWQDGKGVWREGPSARQREMCYRWKT